MQQDEILLGDNLDHKMCLEPQIVRHRSKKDTKRWCKGRVGIEHQYGDWVDIFPDMHLGWRIDERRCGVCQKKDLRSVKC